MRNLCRALKDRQVLFILQRSLARVVFVIDKTVCAMLFRRTL